MCNIAGYVGHRDAAPILLKMIKAQEGLNGGFYSGLAVHDGASIGYRKTIGDFDKLLSETDTDRLRGHIGIIHSRTPSGGDASWAHPFVTEREGEVKLCYVANGSIGKFAAEREKFNEMADALVRLGFDIPCKLNCSEDKYCKLATGESVHMSDVMCQLIYKHIVSECSSEQAMARAFTEMPSEIVGLCLVSDAPDRIFYSRINMPMFVGFDSDGAYLASSPTAFPASVERFELLPALSSGTIYRDRYESVKMTAFPQKVRSFNRKTVEKAAAIILEELSRGEKCVKDLRLAVAKDFPKDKLLQTHAILYAALRELLSLNKVCEIRTRIERCGQTAPFTLFKLS